MKRFSCGDVVPGCRSTFRGETETDILSQVAAHARHDHGMAEVPPEVINQVRAKIYDETA
jgi:predicted small metal-binding protein